VSCLDLEESPIKVFGWKVEGLCRKISDNIDAVSSPEGQDSFLFDASTETINDSIVFELKLSILMLSLQQKLDSFNGSSEGLGRDTC